MDVGFQTQASSHGALGAAMIASRNLSDALRLTQRFSPLRQHMARIHFKSDADFYVELEELVALGDIREYLLGQLVAGLAQLLTTLTGRELQAALRIEWPFARPAWAGQYQRLASVNDFDAPCLRIRIDAGLLASPSLAADEAALQLAVRDCELQLQRLQAGGSLSQRVRLQLAQCEGAMPSLEAMANHEHMSVRTFIRRLAAEQQHYQQLLDEVREERACWLLRQTELSIEVIAGRLGYVDTSNFSRTFKRWLGQTPRQFRQQSRV
jgi:AraC-like DNA-binding protein